MVAFPDPSLQAVPIPAKLWETEQLECPHDQITWREVSSKDPTKKEYHPIAGVPNLGSQDPMPNCPIQAFIDEIRNLVRLGTSNFPDS